MVNVQNTNRKCYVLRAGPLLVSNRGDKQSRFLTLYFKARATRFLITHPLSITKPVSGFSKSVHALGSGHLFLLRRDNTIWNRVLFGIGRAFLEKAALVDLRGYGALIPISLWLQGMMSICGRANATYQSTRARYARH